LKREKIANLSLGVFFFFRARTFQLPWMINVKEIFCSKNEILQIKYRVRQKTPVRFDQKFRLIPQGKIRATERTKRIFCLKCVEVFLPHSVP
jgi:hypothetical protein